MLFRSAYRRRSTTEEFYKTNTWSTDIALLKDVTQMAPLQYTRTPTTTKIKIPLLPLVEKYFFDIERGKIHLYDAITDIIGTIEEVLPYLETNYDISLKMANTCGHSKFITIGVNKMPLNNLALRPRFYIRLKDASYNTNRLKWLIASYINEHDYETYDYHATSMIDEILDQESGAIDILQFIGFDGYTDRMQLLSHTKEEVLNTDVIESTSVKLVYDEVLDEFNYDIGLEFI